MFEITVEKRFCASHALRLPDGVMEPVHEHDWPVAVTVASDRLDAMACVMDFHELEKQVGAVLTPWSGRHLNDVEPFAGGKINPSAEQVAWQIGRSVAGALPEGVTLKRVSVGEAIGCTAVWRPAQ